MSYKQQILIGFVLLISFFEVAVISYDVHNAYQLRQDFLQQRSQLITQTYTKALIIPVWNLDKETSNSILHSILVDPDIVKIQLNYLDQTLPMVQLTARNAPSSLSKNTFVTHHSITEPDNDNIIASLNIHFSKQGLEEFLSKRITEALIQFAILLVINLSLAILLINWITSPLIRLSETIRRLANHELDISIPETKRNDEIGLVANSVAILKKNNLELDELRISMQNKIKEQTKDLVVAKEKAEAATTAKSQFLATMSHEIRTPLNGVLGMAQILSDSQLNKKQQESIRIILNSGQTLVDIINEILDFSKLDAHQVELEYISFNLRQQIEELFILLSPSLIEKKLSLVLDYSHSSPDYYIGDPLRIKQILLNLLSNAIKFTHKGSITLSVQYQRTSQQSSHSSPILEIKVIDTGIGISDKQKQNLFDAFTQADQATTRKYGGTGLGLSICKKLVDLMEGDIEIDSKPNQGSTFLLRLKLLTDKKYLKQSKQASGEADNQNNFGIEPNNPLLQSTILLVEDNQVNQRIALIMLKKLGLKVVVAIDGEDALKQWNEHHYPFIYMDCLMPNMDGYQATQEIRKQQNRHHHKAPVIVALTANASSEDTDKCIKSGMDDIVTKPFKKIDLINNINKWGEHLKTLVDPA